jgi:Holliday junction resolvasome RuvABC endonuclease subunit
VAPEEEEGGRVIIGIDIGLSEKSPTAICGIKLVEGIVPYYSSYWLDDKEATKPMKLDFLGTKVVNFTNPDKDRPSLAVIEMPFNVKGNGRILLELLAVVENYLYERNIPIVEVAQTTIKKFATGSGKAEKSAMVKQAYKEFGVDRESDDEVDAFWMAYFGYVLRTGEGKKHRLEAVKKARIVHGRIDSETPF